MFLDARLGNNPKWFFGRPDDLAMRFPESMRKCVVFCARKIDRGSASGLYFRGTGFIVSVPSVKIPGWKYQYIMTARHVAERMRDGDWVIRVNTADGQFIDLEGTKEHEWWCHPTEPERVDVAVVPFFENEVALDAAAVPLSAFLDDKTIKESNIGVGDEVHMTGLFNKMTNKSRNLPIVRTGNVAMIPDRGILIPGVEIEKGVAVDAEMYLVEVRSLGGISGSPVFVRATGTIHSQSRNKATGKVEMMEWSAPGPYFLLGVFHGHWDIVIDDINDPYPRSSNKKEEAVNMGIGLVTPAKKAMEVLYHPELVKMRDNYDQTWVNAQGTTTPD